MKYIIFFVLFSIAIILTGCGNNKKSINTEINTIKETKNPIKDEKYSLKNGIYQLDTQTSSMRWEASKIVGTPHKGNIGIKTGTLEVKAGAITGGNFIIDMSSISEDKNTEAFIRHIKGADFFDVEKYPEASIELTKIVYEMENDKFIIDGDLEIKGVNNNVQFIANFSDKNTNTLNAKSTFTIDRTNWDLKYGSGKFFKELGDAAIRDEISFELDLDFKK